jgi:1,2-phenylacetyl-CoA epoxidase catalytic subunit
LLALLGAHHILHVSRVRVKRSEKTKKSEIKKWDIVKLSKKEVKEEFIKKVTTNVKNTQNKWKIQMKYGTK